MQSSMSNSEEGMSLGETEVPGIIHHQSAGRRSRSRSDEAISAVTSKGNGGRRRSSSEVDRWKSESSDHDANDLINIGYDNMGMFARYQDGGSDDSMDSPKSICVDHVDDAKAQEGLSIHSPPESSSSLKDGKREGSPSCSLNRYKGVILTLFSVIATSFASMAVSALSGRVPSNEVSFSKMMHAFLLSIPLGTFQKASYRLSRNALFWVLYCSLAGSIATMFAYVSFQVMPVGNAKAIMYTAPIFTGLFSCLILRDACNVVDVILSLVTLGGVLLVVQPPFFFNLDDKDPAYPLLGVVFSFLCAILMGANYIALRKMSVHRVHPQTFLLIFAVVGILASGIVTTSLKQWVNPDCQSARLLLIANGVLSFVANTLVTLAAKYERPTIISIIRTTDVLFTFILEYLFFGAIPNFITILGAVVIICCLVGITISRWWSDEKREKESTETSTEN